jgi:eukaryotic-like serine/threonine-protein kinase
MTRWSDPRRAGRSQAVDFRTGAGAPGATRVVAGRYELLERLGAGGMGTVWKARDQVLDRLVALKEVIFPPGLPAEERDVLRERTRREARAAARLHHHNVVTVYDVVEDDAADGGHGSAPFIVMELVQARDLADVVRDDGPLPPHRVAALGLAVLDALDVAHRHGIVHRDVKPGNVLLCDAASGGRVVLTDFGIATSSGDSSMTSSGLLLGSPSYIAPERARGLPAGPESDLFSLGATLFTAVEGRPPFDAGEPLATLTALATGDRAPFAAAGPLEPLLAGLLEPDPAARLDAPAARRMLEDVAVAGPTTAALPRPAPGDQTQRADRTTVLPVGPGAPGGQDRSDVAQPAAAPARPARPVPSPRRSRLPLALAAAALVAVLGVGAVLGALALRPDGDPQAGADTGAAPSPAAEPAAPEEPAEEPVEEPVEPTPQQTAAADGPVAPPEGWQSFSGGPGWEVFVPASWSAGTFRDAAEYRDAGTGRTLRVSNSGPGGGREDAVQDRREQAASFARRYDSYQEIDISRIDYRGLEAADWEFTYAPDGAPLRALSRVFVVDGRGYSLFFQTRASDDWDAARAEFERVAASFRPA